MTTSSAALITARASGETAIQQRRVLQAIAATGWVTRQRLVDLTPYSINVICPRVLELIGRGYVRRVGRTNERYSKQVLAMTDKGREWLGGKS